VPLTHHTDETEFGLLPTPLAQHREQTNFEAYDQRMKRLEQKGHRPFTMPLDQMALRGLLPTPNSFDWNTARSLETLEKAKERHKEKGVVLQNSLRQMAGQGFQLSPLFVEEMMGFPKNWTTLPFQNGETKVSKPTEMQ
jgi:hypothetical protein